MGTHFIKFYACGEHILTQCRCPSKDKTRIVTSQECPTCGPGEVARLQAEVEELRAIIKDMIEDGLVREGVIFGDEKKLREHGLLEE